jgi:integrase
LNVTTQGDYRFSEKIEGSKKRIKELMSQEEYAILEKYEIEMVKSSLADGTKAKNYDEILGLTRMLKGNWLDVNQDDIDSLVVSIMNRYSDNGKETNSTSDKKRFLKIWFRFVRLGSRSFKRVGDPVETHGLEIKSIDSKITRMQLITPEEKKKLLDACTNLRDKCLIDVHYDAGTRIGEILSVQIKHVKNDKIGYRIAVDGKTGSRPIRILESSTSLARWLESHPHRDNPEAWLFPNMKTIWSGSKFRCCIPCSF